MLYYRGAKSAHSSGQPLKLAWKSSFRHVLCVRTTYIIAPLLQSRLRNRAGVAEAVPRQSELHSCCRYLFKYIIIGDTGKLSSSSKLLVFLWGACTVRVPLQSK